MLGIKKGRQGIFRDNKCYCLSLVLIGIGIFLQILGWKVQLGFLIPMFLVIAVLILALNIRLFKIVMNAKSILLERFNRKVNQWLEKKPDDFKDNVDSVLEILEAKKLYFYFLGNYMFVLVAVVVAFAGAFKLSFLYDQKSFYFLNPLTSQTGNGLFDFMYYSLITITTTGSGDILPFSGLARILSFLEIANGLFLLVLVINIYFFVLSQKDNLLSELRNVARRAIEEHQRQHLQIAARGEKIKKAFAQDWGELEKKTGSDSSDT